MPLYLRPAPVYHWPSGIQGKVLSKGPVCPFTRDRRLFTIGPVEPKGSAHQRAVCPLPESSTCLPLTGKFWPTTHVPLYQRPAPVYHWRENSDQRTRVPLYLRPATVHHWRENPDQWTRVPLYLRPAQVYHWPSQNQGKTPTDGNSATTSFQNHVRKQNHVLGFCCNVNRHY